MKLKGDPNNLNSLQVDQQLYLLMRKVGGAPQKSKKKP